MTGPYIYLSSGCYSLCISKTLKTVSMPIRVILQRINSAQLLINGKSFYAENEQKPEDEWIESGEGVMIYIAFFKDTTKQEIDQLINKIFSNPLFRTLKQETKKHDMESGNEERTETDILIVPQFSLGGKMKSGKAGAQYHQNEKPNVAKQHYQSFCDGLIRRNEANQRCKKKCKNLRVNIHCGIFGNRQGLRVESHGPFSHCFDINLQSSKPQNTESAKSKKRVNKTQIDTQHQGQSNQDNAQSNMCSQLDDIIRMIQRL